MINTDAMLAVSGWHGAQGDKTWTMILYCEKDWLAEWLEISEMRTERCLENGVGS